MPSGQLAAGVTLLGGIIRRLVKAGSLVIPGPSGAPPDGLRIGETVDEVADLPDPLTRPQGSTVFKRNGLDCWRLQAGAWRSDGTWGALFPYAGQLISLAGNLSKILDTLADVIDGKKATASILMTGGWVPANNLSFTMGDGAGGMILVEIQADGTYVATPGALTVDLQGIADKNARLTAIANVVLANTGIVDGAVNDGTHGFTASIVGWRVNDLGRSVNNMGAGFNVFNFGGGKDPLSMLVGCDLQSLIVASGDFYNGARGMRHLTDLDWAPTIDSDGHDFAIDVDAYTDIEFRINRTQNPGGNLVLEVTVDGVMGGGGNRRSAFYSGTAQLNDSAGVNLQIGSETEEFATWIRFRVNPTNLIWQSESGRFVTATNWTVTRNSGSLPRPAATLGLSSNSNIFKGGQTTVEVWGRPV